MRAIQCQIMGTIKSTRGRKRERERERGAVIVVFPFIINHIRSSAGEFSSQYTHRRH